MVPIKCVSPRTPHVDLIYKTGDWKEGETKNIDKELARKLLRHVDVFVKSTDKPASKAVVIPEKMPEPDKMQETYDLIATMTKDAVQTFVKNNFNRGVDMRLSEANLRAYAIQLTDQYGLP